MHGKPKNYKKTSNLKKSGRVPPTGKKGSCKIKMN